jgi:WW domain-containing oxidoreductase
MDLTDKTAIITGANTGIGKCHVLNEHLINILLGFEIARSLAKHGCQVILACRNLAKGEAACLKIRKEQVFLWHILNSESCSMSISGECEC